jgi:hypothetical protein
MKSKRLNYIYIYTGLIKVKTGRSQKAKRVRGSSLVNLTQLSATTFIELNQSYSIEL